ncbi:hypothetical protein I203_102970 [Kwoniella mangroviensis CBS 8507]|uniref:uncharacterized protein n=1 Tax=Kwoniella mangroviensis CBS 8507 TaxID=1296122 RepID=UPI00080D3A4E|nr:uncharacterized protein I203_03947 [Kwoniella mangroviensis CBS 8507]OCF67259.1 hypothetical protein I203_03947 [Kwoniella mangroviensis CBS 8507]
MSSHSFQSLWSTLTGQTTPSNSQTELHKDCFALIKSLKEDRNEFERKLKASEDEVSSLKRSLEGAERKLILTRGYHDQLELYQGILVDKLSVDVAKLDSRYFLNTQESSSKSGSGTGLFSTEDENNKLSDHYRSDIRKLVDNEIQSIYNSAIDHALPVQVCLWEGTRLSHVEIFPEDLPATEGERRYEILFGNDVPDFAMDDDYGSTLSEIVKRRTLTFVSRMPEDVINSHLQK